MQRAVWHALRWETEAGEEGQREEGPLRADFAVAAGIQVLDEGSCTVGPEAVERGAAGAKELEAEGDAISFEPDKAGDARRGRLRALRR